MNTESSPTASDIVAFWREAGPARWFAKDEAFDRLFRERFLVAHETAAAGQLTHWLGEADSALALVLLLDQFPRNAFRDTPRMYATDVQARDAAHTMLASGLDQRVHVGLRLFCYLPFSHAENLAEQELAVRLQTPLGAEYLRHAEGHRDIIRRFGRFPHRNRILGRATTTAEQAFLDEGGFRG
ncbi:MAG: DUF924 family protein [Moraxellaceae bacterium]|nr:DUF924 family protein [Moraxellaceae bacterium]